MNNFPISNQNGPQQVNNKAQGPYQVNNKAIGMNNFPISNKAQGMNNFSISNQNNPQQVNNFSISNQNNPQQVNNKAQGMNNIPISNQNDPYQVNNKAQGMNNFSISNQNDPYQVNNKAQGMNNIPNSNQNNPYQVNNQAPDPYNTNQQGGNQQSVQINNQVNLDVPPEENESQQEFEGITDKSIRLGFVRKVYSILLVQLILTVAMCCLSMQNQQYALFQKTHIFVLYISIVIILITMFSISCYREVGRTVPINYIFLMLFTAGEGYLVSFACSIYDPRVVILAAIYTLVVTLSLTLYAMTTKNDFTGCGSCLLTLMMVLFLSGFFLIFTHDKWQQILYCSLWALIYAIYIVYDTQIILGKFGVSISPDDYIFASMTLYIDIIGLFMDLLQIINYLTPNN